MSSRFPGVHFIASLVGVIFGLCLCAGLYLLLMLAQPPETRAAVPLFQFVPQSAIITIAATLIVLGLFGLLTAGAVRVLIAIEGNTRMQLARVSGAELSNADRKTLLEIRAT